MYMQQNLIYVQHTFQICHLKRRFSGLVDGVTASTRNSRAFTATSIRGWFRYQPVKVLGGWLMWLGGLCVSAVIRLAYGIGWFKNQCWYIVGLWHWVVYVPA